MSRRPARAAARAVVGDDARLAERADGDVVEVSLATDWSPGSRRRRRPARLRVPLDRRADPQSGPGSGTATARPRDRPRRRRRRCSRARPEGLQTLLAGWQPDPAGRAMTDVDLLVPAAAAHTLQAVLETRGWRPHPIGASHHLPALIGPSRTGSIELHHEPVPDSLGVLRAADCWADARRGPGELIWRTGPTTYVAHLVAHAQLVDGDDLIDRVPLRALVDLHRVVGAVGEQIGWDDIDRRFEAAATMRHSAASSPSTNGSSVRPTRRVSWTTPPAGEPPDSSGGRSTDGSPSRSERSGSCRVRSAPTAWRSSTRTAARVRLGWRTSPVRSVALRRRWFPVAGGRGSHPPRFRQRARPICRRRRPPQDPSRGSTGRCA